MTSLPANADRLMPVVPLALFLLVQAGSLALSAARIPFSADFAFPVERAAAHQLLVIQAISATLLFPWLLSHLRPAAVAACSLWPMLILASMLAGKPAHAIVRPGAIMTLWLATLFFLQRLCQTDKSRLIGLAVAAMWCATGPVTWYLRREFTSAETDLPAWLAGPLRGAVVELDGAPNFSFLLAAGVALLITSVLSACYGYFRK